MTGCGVRGGRGVESSGAGDAAEVLGGLTHLPVAVLERPIDRGVDASADVVVAEERCECEDGPATHCGFVARPGDDRVDGAEVADGSERRNRRLAYERFVGRGRPGSSVGRRSRPDRTRVRHTPTRRLRRLADRRRTTHRRGRRRDASPRSPRLVVGQRHGRQRARLQAFRRRAHRDAPAPRGRHRERSGRRRTPHAVPARRRRCAQRSPRRGDDRRRRTPFRVRTSAGR